MMEEVQMFYKEVGTLRRTRRSSGFHTASIWWFWAGRSLPRSCTTKDML